MATHTPVHPAATIGTEDAVHHETPAESAKRERQLEGQIRRYLVGGLLVLLGWLADVLGIGPEEIAQIPALIGTLVLAWELFYAAVQEIRKGLLGSSTLASLAILAALATEMYTTAGFLAFVLLVADKALRRTAVGARRAIEQLVHLTPDTARIVEGGVEREVDLGEVTVGMIVRVRAGENLPVDGEVISGTSMINQASLTGEAAAVEVQDGSPVYAGTTNLTGNIDIRVTLVGAETVIGQVAQLIHEAESARTPRQLMIEQVARYVVPVALVTAALVWYITKDVESAISVLVVACPSALLLASPTAMMASFAAAARLGIRIKQTSYLEAASNIDTVVLDKTGTLTTGRFEVSKLVPAEAVEGEELLRAAADAEQHSNHPLALSIMQTSKQANITPAEGRGFEEIHGRGVRGSVGPDELLAGRASWLLELDPSIKDELESVESRIEGMTGVHVMKGGRYLGVVGLEDKLRYNARGVIEKLRELGVRTIQLFTGDRFEVAKRVGMSVDVDKLEAECLPEEKHDLIVQMVGQGRRVLMVGDGINDGPSLAAADVGVAMGLSGSDIATNSAGVALMNDDLSRVPFLMMLARRTRIVIGQNIAASILIAIAGLAAAATGLLGIGFAAFYHFLGDVFVIGNSFRLIRFGEEFAAHDQHFASGGTSPAAGAEIKRRASASLRRPEPVGAGS